MRKNDSQMLVLAFAVGLAFALPNVGQTQQVGCRAADSASTRVLQHVKILAALAGEARDSLGLTSVDSSTIVVETDSIACVRVAQVVDPVFAATPGMPYVVVRGGSRYLAFVPNNDPDNPSRLLHVVDSAYLYRRTQVAF